MNLAPARSWDSEGIVVSCVGSRHCEIPCALYALAGPDHSRHMLTTAHTRCVPISSGTSAAKGSELTTMRSSMGVGGGKRRRLTHRSVYAAATSGPLKSRSISADASGEKPTEASGRDAMRKKGM